MPKPHYVECGGCDHLHPAHYLGDCRADDMRFTYDQLDDRHGEHGYTVHDGEGDDPMGYTHYFTQTRDFSAAEMLTIGDTIARFIKEATGKPTSTAGGYHQDPVAIRGGDGTGLPELTEKRICFNGNGPDLDHETFHIPATREEPYPGGTLGWQCCKTARKPYDVVVVASLAYLAAKWGFDVSSDGGAEDWEAGVELAQTVTGEPIPNPLIVEQLTA